MHFSRKSHSKNNNTPMFQKKKSPHAATPPWKSVIANVTMPQMTKSICASQGADRYRFEHCFGGVLKDKREYDLQDGYGPGTSRHASFAD